MPIPSNAAPPSDMLATLIRYGETLLRDGDEFGPLDPEQALAVSIAVAGWRDRFNRFHLGPVAERVTSDNLFDLAMMVDGLVVHGDGALEAFSDVDFVHSYNFRAAAVTRGVQAPGGERTARILGRNPVASAALRRAVEARTALQAARMTPPPQVSFPVASPPPVADAFVFRAEQPAAVPAAAAPEPPVELPVLELPLGPQKPATATPAVTGSPTTAPLPVPMPV